MFRIVIMDKNIDYLQLMKKMNIAYFRSKRMSHKISTYSDAESFIKQLGVEYYDIAIIDVLFGQNEFGGIQIGKMINEVMPRCSIIFVTLRPDYFQKVYSVKHAYTIYKPNIIRLLPEALERVVHADLTGKDSFIRIKYNWTYEIVPKNRIVYIESERRKVIFHCVGKQLEAYYTFAELSEELGEMPFIRCHRSYIVNVSYVLYLKEKEIITVQNERIPIGDKYRYSVEEILLKEKRVIVQENS